ncbi:hypothetical protein HK100_002291 [Physocladia obscura]|uniref:DIS3-like exonuclease 2 n=1 Tax=Physocladia obscura TaxID=109957 RepID=A0AAD5T8U2_9FUNG|nr:hypothetical protein HK100_002291 [Physocladia obscura]
MNHESENSIQEKAGKRKGESSKKEENHSKAKDSNASTGGDSNMNNDANTLSKNDINENNTNSTKKKKWAKQKNKKGGNASGEVHQDVNEGLTTPNETQRLEQQSQQQLRTKMTKTNQISNETRNTNANANVNNGNAGDSSEGEVIDFATLVPLTPQLRSSKKTPAQATPKIELQAENSVQFSSQIRTQPQTQAKHQSWQPRLPKAHAVNTNNLTNSGANSSVNAFIAAVSSPPVTNATPTKLTRKLAPNAPERVSILAQANKYDGGNSDDGQVKSGGAVTTPKNADSQQGGKESRNRRRESRAEKFNSPGSNNFINGNPGAQSRFTPSAVQSARQQQPPPNPVQLSHTPKHKQNLELSDTSVSWRNSNNDNGNTLQRTPQNLSKRSFGNCTPATPGGFNSPNAGYNSPRGGGGRNGPNLFEDYIPLASVQEGLQKKTLYQGLLRINKRSFFDAYVTVDGFDDDIYIPGKFKRNRAFDGDMVIIQILKDAELKKELDRTEDEAESKVKVMLDDEEGTEEQEIFGAEVDGIESKAPEARIYGKVVHILEQKEAHMVIGKLSVENPGHPNKTKFSNGQPVDSSINTIWFRPNDQRVPYIVVPVEHVPIEYLKSPKDYENSLWRLSVTKWPSHCQYPFGKVGGLMGIVGEIPVETDSLLLENGISWSDFSESVLKCLPPTPWAIPEYEYLQRKDFRNVRIFSVDPQTARDLDDALSVVLHDDGSFEIGVHIADVSYFVTKDTALDKEAQNRSTTVYLIQKAIPMLPRLLCEELCSLNPGVERLAFSVVWQISKDGIVQGDPWFGKSIIKSCAKLSYDHAQALIEGRDWTGLPKVEIDGKHTVEDIRADTMRLFELSVKLRQRRYEGGALAINSFKLWFSLDANGNPIDTGVYELKDSNRMIEEFMLLANMAVAKKISDAFPGSALLRRHEPPKSRPLKQFLEFSAEIGYPIDASTSYSFQASFDAIQNMNVENVLRQLAIKPMQRAKYFCTGLLETKFWEHYALNVPLYTHFTSPIRRYCDLIVHRQLEAALFNDAEPHDTDSVGLFARVCNERKFGSKDAQDASQRLYLSIYLDRLANSDAGCPLIGLEALLGVGKHGVIVEALVYKVAERSFDVIVERYGLEKRVWIEQSLAMYGVSFEKAENFGKQSCLTVLWKVGYCGDDGISGISDAMKLLAIETLDGGHENEGNIIVEDDSGWETLDENTVDIQQPTTAVNALATENKTQLALNNEKPVNGRRNHRRTKKRTNVDASKTITQKIHIFDRIPVVLVSDIKKSPPDIKAYLIHPDAAEKHRYLIDTQKIVTHDRIVDGENFSCPAIENEMQQALTPGFQDFSGVSTAEFENPYDALIAATGNDAEQLQVRYDSHRTARNAQQKEKLLSPEFPGFLIDFTLLRLVADQENSVVTDSRFVDPRHSLVVWARPSKAIQQIVLQCQEMLHAVAPNLWVMPLDSLHTTVLEVTHSRTAQEVDALAAQMQPAVEAIVNIAQSQTHRSRLVRPLLGFDASAIALSFVPAAGESGASSTPDGNDSYSYHHLRRDVFALAAAAGVTINSRYAVPSAHFTIARFIRTADDFAGGEGTPLDHLKIEKFVDRLELINAWLKREFWPNEIDGKIKNGGEWLVGKENGLIVRKGTLWYGGGESIREGNAYN